MACIHDKRVARASVLVILHAPTAADAVLQTQLAPPPSPEETPILFVRPPAMAVPFARPPSEHAVREG